MTQTITQEKKEFLSLLQSALENNTFVKMTLGKYRGKEQGLERTFVKRLVIRDEAHLSLVYRYTTQDITRNFSVSAGLEKISGMLGGEFKAGHLFTLEGDSQIEFSKKGKALLRTTAGSRTTLPSTAHNKKKNRLLDPATPFLHRLGITTPDGEIIPSMSRKWKQINKFLEIFSHAVEKSGILNIHSEQNPLAIVDFGSGKGYLTFAVQHWLSNRLPFTETPPDITGVELRKHLTDQCESIATDLNLSGLSFFPGDIGTFASEKLDVMIALHACDVATDLALYRGIFYGARIIMSAPCCHKEIRPQMHSPEVLEPMLRHGTHMEQQAEMVTDTLRALLLEAHGYTVQIFEFVALEHTSKNKMILATKTGEKEEPQRREALEKVRRIKEFYGIERQTLEELLAQGEQ